MPIDNCPHSFEHLVFAVLPDYMEKLRQAIKCPHNAAEFAIPGVGSALGPVGATSSALFATNFGPK